MIVNNIVAFNDSGIQIARGSLPRNNCVFGNPVYNYSGIPDPTGTNGNISLDPVFVANEFQWDFHLSPDSPCKDAGDNSVIKSAETDFDGDARVEDGSVDIGADEFAGSGPVTSLLRIVRVGTDGNDSNDGSSWIKAKRTIQAALDTATMSPSEVWVEVQAW